MHSITDISQLLLKLASNLFFAKEDRNVKEIVARKEGAGTASCDGAKITHQNYPLFSPNGLLLSLCDSQNKRRKFPSI